MTERIVLRAAGSEAGRPGTEFTAGPNDAAGCSPRTGIAAKTRPRPAAGPASFSVDRSLYFYRHIGMYPLEPPGENEFHKVSHEVFYVRAKKL